MIIFLLFSLFGIHILYGTEGCRNEESIVSINNVSHHYNYDHELKQYCIVLENCYALE